MPLPPFVDCYIMLPLVLDDEAVHIFNGTSPDGYGGRMSIGVIRSCQVTKLKRHEMMKCRLRKTIS